MARQGRAVGSWSHPCWVSAGAWAGWGQPEGISFPGDIQKPSGQSIKLFGALRTLAISLLPYHYNVPKKSIGLAVFIKTKKRVQVRGLALEVETRIPQHSSDTFKQGQLWVS